MSFILLVRWKLSVPARLSSMIHPNQLCVFLWQPHTARMCAKVFDIFSISVYIYICIDKNVFKTTRSFCYQWFHVSTLQANATKHGKSTLNLWIVVNRIKCKRFLKSKPITRRRYIHTFIDERSFLACQTFQISNFTSEYTPLTSQNAHTSSFKATYHDGDTIYY